MILRTAIPYLEIYLIYTNVLKEFVQRNHYFIINKKSSLKKHENKTAKTKKKKHPMFINEEII